MFENIVEIYRLLEINDFHSNIRNNIHYLACNYELMISKLGSLH